nr:retrotransposon protein, putative, unclassified [Tanacetum cinerariifolium]
MLKTTTKNAKTTSENTKTSIYFHGNPQQDLKDKGVIDSGCFRNMTGNKSYLIDYEEIDRGFVAFRGNSKRGKITGKDFKLTDESHVLLKVPRKDNMYSVDLKNVVPQGGRKPSLSFMRPFGYHVTILNIIDYRDKFDRKADEGFFIGYFTNSKALRVFNSKTKIVEENLHVKFRNQSNGSAGTKACDNVGKTRVETVRDKDYILIPLWTQDPVFSSSSKDSLGDGFKPAREEEKKDAEDPGNEESEIPINAVGRKSSIKLPNDLNMPDLEDISIFEDSNKDVFGAEADLNNMESTFQDYDEVFAPVVRIEAIRLFLAYASFKDFVVYQMDVKSTFLYGKIEEEVYVFQPLRFKDLDFPDKVYKVEKALYGLHQAQEHGMKPCKHTCWIMDFREE